jgi:flagellar protein FliO/FliZ
MASVNPGFNVLQFSGSLVIVLVLLGATLWMLKRMKHMGKTTSGPLQLELLESVSFGPRQKIVLMRAGAHQVLVGVSPGQFTSLATWVEEPPSTEVKHVA